MKTINKWEDFSGVFNQFNVCEHTADDFKNALMDVFSSDFSIENEYENRWLILHIEELREKGYNPESIKFIFDSLYLETLLRSNFKFNDDIKELLSKFLKFESFSCKFSFENWYECLFDFTQNNNTLEHYINWLLWFIEQDYTWDFTIEYID